MSENKVKCVLFDVDGVVVKSEVFSKKYAKKYGITNDKMLPFFTGVFQDCIVGKTDLKREIESWLPKWRWESTVEEFLELWFGSGDIINQKIIKVVHKLREKNIKCYLTSNQEKYRAEHLNGVMKFDKLFDGAFFFSSIGYKKPEKEFYQFILDDLKKKYNIEAREIIFFDDDQKNVDGAEAVGIKSYLYENFEGFEKIIGGVF